MKYNEAEIIETLNQLPLLDRSSLLCYMLGYYGTNEEFINLFMEQSNKMIESNKERGGVGCLE